MKFSIWAWLLLVLTACATPAPPTPAAPTATYNYSLLPARTTAQPVTPQPSVTAGGNTTVSYSRDLQPIFIKKCLHCHGGVASLWFTDYDHLLLGATNGPVVRPGNAEESTLYTYVRDGLMPVDGPDLPPEQVELIRRWIDEGAVKN